jgi:large subunit GTPase 1
VCAQLGEGRKRPLLLLNKADLLPAPLRRAWASHFDSVGIDYIFWSALAAAEPNGGAGASAAAAAAAPLPGPPPRPAAPRTGSRVVGREELLKLLEARAAAAYLGGDDADGGDEDPRFATGAAQRRIVVGLVGYPNVGKSSTLNALIGEKRAGVGANPGKTKHFQTFNISDTLRLADCPGLVFPSFSDSRAELVAAGVLPIDRLTDVVAPIDVVARRIPRAQLEATYALALPRPQPHEDAKRAPTGRELLRAYAASRGLTAGAGLPDETRAGRAILKDYTSGKLLFCEWPPGMAPAPSARGGGGGGAGGAGGAGGEGADAEAEDAFDEDDDEDDDEEYEDGSGSGSEDDDEDEEAREARRAAAPPSTTATQAVGNALLGELASLGLNRSGGRAGRNGPAGANRAAHKMQQKGKKEKLRRLARGPMATEGVGGMLITGKKGGLMPAAAQVAQLPEFLPSLMRHGAGVAPGGAREPTNTGRPASRAA